MDICKNNLTEKVISKNMPLFKCIKTKMFLLYMCLKKTVNVLQSFWKQNINDIRK